LVDAGIGAAQLLVAQVVPTADGRERVLVARKDHLRLADELLIGRKLEVPRLERREPRRRRIRPRGRFDGRRRRGFARRGQQCAAAEQHGDDGERRNESEIHRRQVTP
jgi:hypothetical protein